MQTATSGGVGHGGVLETIELKDTFAKRSEGFVRVDYAGLLASPIDVR